MHPAYYEFSDQITQLNQINAMMYVHHAVQQALLVLKPNASSVLLSDFSGKTLVSSPLYADL